MFDLLSPLMAPKLMEMDEVVKMIHAGAIMNPDDKKRTLLVRTTSSFSLTCYKIETCSLKSRNKYTFLGCE